MKIRIYPFVALLLFNSCARQTTPDGGPKDIAPPKLLRSTPDQNERNFKGKTLNFTFSEQVKLKDPKEEIIISPEPAKDITFVAKQNRIIIDTKTGWVENTTYSISFRDGVQDITEGNPAENLRLAFSTGPVIDSLDLTGQVVNALTEKIPEKITIAIYQSDTFNIFRHTPTYFTKSDKEGKFRLSNLKPGNYKLYAFEDKNKNLKVETTNEPFGFLPGKISLPLPVDTLRLSLLKMDSRPIRLNNVRYNDQYTTIKFNKALTSYVSSLPQSVGTHSFNADHTEIRVYSKLSSGDSTTIRVQGIDSLKQTIDTAVYIKKTTTTMVKETFKAEISHTELSRETGVFHAEINLTKPILPIHLDSLLLKIDSTNQQPFTRAEIHYDTIQNKITLTKTIDKKLIYPENTIILYVGKGAIISIENDTLKPTIKIPTSFKPEDLATLLLEIQTTKTNYTIQLLSADYKVIQSTKNNKKFAFRNIPPAEYKIRVYLDLNNNDQWDPGNINQDIPPEPTYFYKTSLGKFDFPLRANWEVGPYIITF